MTKQPYAFNAMIEAFWSRMQVELLDTRRWRTRGELANAIFEYIEIFHNRRRRHSSLGMRTPIESTTPWQRSPDQETRLHRSRGTAEPPRNPGRFTRASAGTSAPPSCAGRSPGPPSRGPRSSGCSRTTPRPTTPTSGATPVSSSRSSALHSALLALDERKGGGADQDAPARVGLPLRIPDERSPQQGAPGYLRW